MKQLIVMDQLWHLVRMAIEIVSDSPAFFVVADLLLPITTAKYHSTS